MRLPPHLLRMLSVGSFAALSLTGCADDGDGSEERTQEQALNASQADSGNAQAADGGAAPTNQKAPEVPTNDPCPACGLG